MQHSLLVMLVGEVELIQLVSYSCRLLHVLLLQKLAVPLWLSMTMRFAIAK